MAMSEFEVYQKRSKRLKALENVVSKARNVMSLNIRDSKSGKIQAFYELQKAIEDLDKLPSPHVENTSDH